MLLRLQNRSGFTHLFSSRSRISMGISCVRKWPGNTVVGAIRASPILCSAKIAELKRERCATMIGAMRVAQKLSSRRASRRHRGVTTPPRSRNLASIAMYSRVRDFQPKIPIASRDEKRAEKPNRVAPISSYSRVWRIAINARPRIASTGRYRETTSRLTPRRIPYVFGGARYAPPVATPLPAI